MYKDTEIQLKQHLNDLNLKNILKRYSDVAKQAEKDTWSYEEYLLTLIQEQNENRKARRIKRLLRESRLPLEKNFDTFDLTRLPNKVRHQLKTILTGRFLDYNENILVFGNPGSGKTHLVSAAGQELIRSKLKRIYSTKCALLIQELLTAKRNLELPKLIKKLNRYQTVIIEDIGYVEQSKEEMEVLFTFLAERYECGSVIITSNLPFSKWDKIFKDPMMTTAVIDRLIHHSIIIELNIPSYRMITAKERQNKQKSA